MEDTCKYYEGCPARHPRCLVRSVSPECKDLLVKTTLKKKEQINTLSIDVALMNYILENLD